MKVFYFKKLKICFKINFLNSKAFNYKKMTSIKFSFSIRSSFRIFSSHYHSHKLQPSQLPQRLRNFIEDSAKLCQPDNIHICDGSYAENENMLNSLVASKTIVNLPKYENCWLARTNPADVARVESKTFICTEEKSEAICTPREGVEGALGNWISPKDYEKAIMSRFPG